MARQNYLPPSQTTNPPQSVAASLKGRLKTFNNAPQVHQLLKTYYGIDFEQLPAFTPEEFAALADRAEQAKFFSENLDKIEEHIKTYIKGVIDYNEFVSRCVRVGVAGIKKIDKTTLNTFLEWKGYEAHTKKLASDSDVEQRLLEQDLANYQDLAEYTLNAALQKMAARLAKAKQDIDARPDEEALRQHEQALYTWERNRSKQLINYGTRALRTLPPAPVNNTGKNPININAAVTAIVNFFRGK